MFAQLQRERDLNRRLGAIVNPEFRFGILSGESGCGKSSFLQAGLLPRLEQARHRCVYVKLTNEDPLVSIRLALTTQLRLSNKEVDGIELLPLLETVVSSDTRPLVLLLDQFEQFFLYYKREEEREPFVRQLVAWYQRFPTVAVKMLICIRGDFNDLLIELQTAMGYFPEENMRLEKFKPEEAARIIGAMAELEQLPLDLPFVEEVTREELANRDDGRVSPVDLQVLAWLVKWQKDAEERAFTRNAFHKLGGVEGLLERFLQDILRARQTEARKQAALKVLLGLIDLDRNARAGTMTVDQLQAKLDGTLASGEVMEAVEWLGREDIRLLTPTERQGTLRYELAHERLIPAIRKIAGKQLSASDKANQLLDRRVNEWLGNDRRSRYLLSWREWLQVQRHRPYLIWGPQKEHKEELLRRTRQRWTRYGWVLGGLLCLAGLAMVWWVSPWGRIQQVKWSIDLMAINQDPQTLAILENYASIGDIQRAQVIADRFFEPQLKQLALVLVAEGYANRGEATKSAELIVQAQRLAEGIEHPGAGAYALGAAAATAARIGETAKSAEGLAQAQRVAESIADPVAKAYAMGAVAVAAARMGEGEKSAEWIAQAQHVVDGIGNPAYKAYALGAIAQQMARIGEAMKSAEWIAQAQHVAEGIVEDTAVPSTKAFALGAVAVAAARIAEATKSTEWVAQAQHVAEGIVGDPETKPFALGAVTEAMARIGDSTKSAELVAQAQRRAKGMEDPVSKAHALGVAAQVAARIGDTTKSQELVAQAQRVAEEIQNPAGKAWALGQVAQAAARLGDWGLAQKSAAFNVDPLFAILQIWRNPDRPVQLPKHEFQ